MKELTYGQYVKLFTEYVPKAERVDRSTYRGRCTICGDSKKDNRKKRLYLLRENNSFPHMITCHNCGYRKSARNYFLLSIPDEFKKLSKKWNERDLSDIKKVSQGLSIFVSDKTFSENDPDAYLKVFDKELVKAKEVLTVFFQKYTYKIQDNDEALNYMMQRNIPDAYIAEMRLLRPEFHDHKKFRYAYFQDYIMIPFLDMEDCLPYYFHSRRFRNLETSMSKYLACPYRPSESINFYLNEMRITSDLPVIIIEGTLDAMHVDNSIAVNGVHKITEEQVKLFEHRYGTDIIYALDNEMIDKEANKKVKQLLKMGKTVFLWSSLAKESPNVGTIKDFNKLCVVAKQKHVPIKTIQRHTKNNIAALLQG